jgi:2-polyprenyl-3-methyl-5-hydroxy-6-metoxy-1,4-benzoquinol methylase
MGFAMSSTSSLKNSDIAFQAKLYDATNPTRKWLHTSRRDWVFHAIDARIAAGAKRVLEVGVGAGVFTRYLSARSCLVTAVDINAAFLAGVAGLPGVTVIEADVVTLELAGFDLAVCSEVLEHLPPQNSVPALQRLHNALRPGGVLILTTPQSFSTMELFARMLRNPLVMALAKKLYGAVDELGHINLLTRAGLHRQIEQAGFIIVEEARNGLYVPGLAEFGGQAGQKVAAAIAHGIRNMPILSALPWAQCYVLRRPT